MTTSDKTYLSFDLGRCADVVETNVTGDRSHLLFVSREQVRVGEDNGDGSIAFGIQLEKIFSDLYRVCKLQ